MLFSFISAAYPVYLSAPFLHHRAKEKAHHGDGLHVKTKAHRSDGLHPQHPIMQALAPCPSGRLLCGHRACLSRTLYGQLGSNYWINIRFSLQLLLRIYYSISHSEIQADFLFFFLLYSLKNGPSVSLFNRQNVKRTMIYGFHWTAICYVLFYNLAYAGGS